MAKIFVTKQLNGTLKANHDTDFEVLKRFKAGDTIQVEVKKPRNLGFHRKFFALVNMAFQNQELYKNQDHFRKDLTIAAGFFEEYVDLGGEYKKVAKSISFTNMDALEFDKLYSAFLDTVIEIFKWEKQDIIENLQEFY